MAAVCSGVFSLKSSSCYSDGLLVPLSIYLYLSIYLSIYLPIYLSIHDLLKITNKFRGRTAWRHRDRKEVIGVYFISFSILWQALSVLELTTTGPKLTSYQLGSSSRERAFPSIPLPSKSQRGCQFTWLVTCAHTWLNYDQVEGVPWPSLRGTCPPFSMKPHEMGSSQVSVSRRGGIPGRESPSVTPLPIFFAL